MSFTTENIRSLANLARLSLTDEELNSCQQNLEEIVGYVEALQKVDVEGIEPMPNAVPVELPRREDQDEGSSDTVFSAGWWNIRVAANHKARTE